MHRYLPFSPQMEQVYEEYAISEDSMNLDTRAFDYLVEAVNAEARIVVLTGDAGHGKTYLCRRLIQKHLGYSQSEAREVINTKCDGVSLLTNKENPGRRGIKINKDISEMAVEMAVSIVDDAVTSRDATTVICANEGRLRAILDRAGDSAGCRELADAFFSSFTNGLAATDDGIHIINLNFQSVSSRDTGNDQSLLLNGLSDWANGTRWKACSTCSSAELCPIRKNQLLFTSPEGKELKSRRHERLEAVFASAERLGLVITIRELLMTLAYLFTGGLRCTDVHQKIKKRKIGWQHEYAFYNLLFTPPDEITSTKVKSISTLAGIARLDPGQIAIRQVDERLINEQDQLSHDQIDLVFAVPKQEAPVDAANGIDDIIGTPTSRSERLRESELVSSVVRSLRRRYFFDEDSEFFRPLERLGFDDGDSFLNIVNGDLAPSEKAKLKRKVVAGLHMIQGLNIRANEASLYLVDPAFGSATAKAGIIARKIASSSIHLIPMSEKWSISASDEKRSLQHAVNWQERYIVLRISGKDDHVDFPMDLILFNCVMSAGRGFTAEGFYGHDIRKIRNFLGRLAESGGESGEDIQLWFKGSPRSVTIDDGMIQVGAS